MAEALREPPAWLALLLSVGDTEPEGVLSTVATVRVADMETEPEGEAPSLETVATEGVELPEKLLLTEAEELAAAPEGLPEADRLLLLLPLLLALGHCELQLLTLAVEAALPEAPQLLLLLPEKLGELLLQGQGELLALLHTEAQELPVLLAVGQADGLADMARVALLQALGELEAAPEKLRLPEEQREGLLLPWPGLPLLLAL